MPQTIEAEQELQTQAMTVVQQAHTIVVVDQPSYDSAASLLLEVIKPMRKKMADYWTPLKETAYRSYKQILDKYGEMDKPMELAEAQVKAALSKFTQEQERIRQVEQRRAQEEAERLEREEKEKHALEAIDAGVSEEQIEAMLSAPPTAVAPVIGNTYQAAAGISTRENWQGDCFDLKALCRAIGAGKVPTTYVVVNQAAINARAKADKTTLDLPGVRAINRPIIAGRSKP
jgi:hypothetical protein